MSEASVPEGWTTTEVAITETTTYTVAVAHPPTATAAEIATVGYDVYRQALHPDTTFPHTVGPDEVAVAGESLDGESRWPGWAGERPDPGRRDAAADVTGGWAA